MNLTRGINLRKIAEMMPGASGAEVKVYSLVLFLIFIEDICAKNVYSNTVSMLVFNRKNVPLEMI